VVAFRLEILLVLRLMRASMQFILHQPVNPLSPNTIKALVILGVNIFVYFVFYFIILKWISFFILPAQNPQESKQVYERLIEYIFQLHGPAIFVKNGELITRKEEELKNDAVKARFASLALVDLSSAIVLESRSLPAIINVRQSGHWVQA
jgi:hypothetical protein